MDESLFEEALDKLLEEDQAPGSEAARLVDQLRAVLAREPPAPRVETVADRLRLQSVLLNAREAVRRVDVLDEGSDLAEMKRLLARLEELRNQLRDARSSVAMQQLLQDADEVDEDLREAVYALESYL